MNGACSDELPYYKPVREKVLGTIRKRGLTRASDRVGVAVSGGADSVALLRVLLELRGELGVVLFVAHFDHGLRGEESAADAAFVKEVARELELEFFLGRGDVRAHAAREKLSIEAAARDLRYGWLAQLAGEQRLDVIATAHTLDDQAETVLLKFLRGAGTKGLAGIYPVVRGDEKVRVVRPLLEVARTEVESYLEFLDQPWREDESNLDRRFTRNRVRHDLLPLLERDFNPNVRRTLNDVAEIARGEEEYWQALIAREMAGRSAAERRLDLAAFADLPLALQRRLLKQFAADQGLALDFEHVEKLRRCARGEMTKAELPGDVIGVSGKGFLELRWLRPPSHPGYEYELPVPGEVAIVEAGVKVRALVVAEEFARELDSGELLDAELLGTQLVVRNWRPGDRFWPVHRGSEEKLKRLFGEKKIPAEERGGWPVVTCGGDIVGVRGFAAARAYRWTGWGNAVRIEWSDGSDSSAG